MLSKPAEQGKAIVNHMHERDAFSIWLGIQIIEVEPGYAKLSMEVRPDMVNGFGIAHGGIAFSLADSAMAFASNARGRHAMSVHTHMAYCAQVAKGDTIYAEARETSLGHKIALYHIDVTNQDNTRVASFEGTVYRSGTAWEIA